MLPRTLSTKDPQTLKAHPGGGQTPPNPSAHPEGEAEESRCVFESSPGTGPSEAIGLNAFESDQSAAAREA